LNNNIDLELDLARNMFGKLSPAIRRRIEAVVSQPTQETWEDAHCIIIGSDGWMTFWQAVIIVDPFFPRIGPSPDSEWSEIPSRAVLRTALQYATH